MDAKLRKRLDDHSVIMVDNVCSQSSGRQKRQAIDNRDDIGMEEMKELYINFIMSPLWQEAYKSLHECDWPPRDKETELNPRKYLNQFYFTLLINQCW